MTILKPEEWKKLSLIRENKIKECQIIYLENKVNDLLKEGKSCYRSTRIQEMQHMEQVLLKSGYAAKIACITFSNDLFLKWKLPEEVSWWERNLGGWKVPKKDKNNKKQNDHFSAPTK